MAKVTKKAIIGGLEESYLVEKSRPLVLMKEVPFALGELKILDTYLSRINARDPSATTVRFSKEEYEDLMGIDRMHPARLEKYVKSIMSKTVSVPDADARGGWRIYTLFDEAVCSQDEHEQWWIDLSCTRKAKELFFNIEGIGFIQYQLKNVLPLSSKYSVLLYIYLLDNRFRGSWTVTVQDLREKVFRCSDPLYEEFKYLNQRILKKSIEEVNEKTDLTFCYEPQKTGRRVTGIKFSLIKDAVELPLDLDPDQLKLAAFDEDEPDQIKDANALYAASLPSDLTPDQVEMLRALAVEKIPYDNSVGLDGMQLQLADFLSKKHKLMLSQKNPVVNHFAWLRKAIENDWE